VQVRVPAGAEGDQQAVHAATLAGERIPPEAQQAEIHLGDLARRRRGDAHRHGGVPEVAVSARKPIERGVGDRDALLDEPPVHLRQPQPVLRQPRRDGRAVRQERLHLVAERRRAPRCRVVAHRRELLVRHRRPAADHADRLRRGDVPHHRLAIDAGPAGDRPHAVAADPPPNDFAKFDHPQLPIGHAHLPGRQHGPGSRRAEGMGECS
jgi:hypothetical protein